MRSMFWLVLVLLVGFPIGSMAQESSIQEDLLKIRRDPPPESLTQGHSYLTSDESELHLFKPYVTPRGGLYVGIGTDPNYVFAAWSKADVAVLVDFDQNVVDLHRVYAAFFAAAATPSEFLALWEKKNKDAAYAAIDAFDAKRAKRLKRIYEAGRRKVLPRLEWMRDHWPALGAPTFVTDLDQYGFVAKMSKEGRIYSVRGDLTKDKTMKDIGKFAKKHNLKVTTLYLTNAEYYFTFETGDYVANITGLPMEDDSIVLHTFPRSQKEYRYIFETGPHYQAWVKSGKMADLRELIRRRAKKIEGHENLLQITKLPDGTDTAEPAAKVEPTKTPAVVKPKAPAKAAE